MYRTIPIYPEDMEAFIKLKVNYCSKIGKDLSQAEYFHYLIEKIKGDAHGNK